MKRKQKPIKFRNPYVVESRQRKAGAFIDERKRESKYGCRNFVPRNHDVDHQNEEFFMSNEDWNDDSIQFPRLLYMIEATQNLNLETLASSMSLSMHDVQELLDRACNRWEEIKDSWKTKKENT